MVIIAALVLLTLAMLLLGGLALASRGDGKKVHTIEGIFTLSDFGVTGSVGNCAGTGRYDDFGSGMDVTVRDGEGAIVGTSATRNGTRDELRALEAGRIVDDEGSASESALVDALPDDEEGVDQCTVFFETTVKDADLYEVEVGKRGKTSYSREDVEKRDWRVEFTLG